MNQSDKAKSHYWQVQRAARGAASLSNSARIPRTPYLILGFLQDRATLAVFGKNLKKIPISLHRRGYFKYMQRSIETWREEANRFLFEVLPEETEKIRERLRKREI